MKDLIKVEEKIIGDNKVNSVDARELHEFLEVTIRFDKWIKRKINEYDFVMNSDFYLSIPITPFGRPATEYLITIDMAKELSMVEKNDKGKEARKYFIAIQSKAEKILKSVERLEFKGEIDGIVFSRNGEGYTSSKIIASKFEKHHSDVIRAIDSILSKSMNNAKINEFTRHNFELAEYVSKTGKLRKFYNITEQGFFALEFTGEKAMGFKINFINAFFCMREAIKDRFKAEMVKSVFPEIILKRQFVYIIGNEDNSYLKIGVSNDVSKRLKQLQTGSWSKLSVLYKSMVCSNAFNIETIVHNKIDSENIRGEWYDISFDDAVSLIEKENVILNTSLLKEYYDSKNDNFGFDIDD